MLANTKMSLPRSNCWPSHGSLPREISTLTLPWRVKLKRMPVSRKYSSPSWMRSVPYLREEERADALDPETLAAARIEVDLAVAAAAGEAGAAVKRRVHLEVAIVVLDLPARLEAARFDSCTTTCAALPCVSLVPRRSSATSETTRSTTAAMTGGSRDRAPAAEVAAPGMLRLREDPADIIRSAQAHRWRGRS